LIDDDDVRDDCLLLLINEFGVASSFGVETVEVEPLNEGGSIDIVD
jgi:hypothetical protein